MNYIPAARAATARPPRLSRQPNPARRITANNLFCNRLADSYFASPIGSPKLSDYIRIMKNLPKQLQIEKDRVDELSDKDIIKEAVGIIKEFLNQINKSFGIKEPVTGIGTNDANLVTQFIEQKPNGIHDIGKLCERLSTAELWLQIGKVDRASEEFNKIYPVLAAGYILSTSKGKEKEASPPISQPLSAAEISPAAAEQSEPALLSPEHYAVIRDQMKITMGPKVRSFVLAVKYREFFSVMCTTRYSPEIKQAIEKGIDQFSNKNRSAVMRGTAGATAIKIYENEPMYTSRVGTIRKILESWTNIASIDSKASLNTISNELSMILLSIANGPQ